MKNYFEALQACPFLQSFPAGTLKDLWDKLHWTPVHYGRGEFMSRQGEPVDSLGIILAGTASVQKLAADGSTATIAHLQPGQTFGEAVLFARQNRYPASVTAASAACTALFIPRRELVHLWQQDERFLLRYMEIMSQRIMMLGQRIELLSQPSIRQKISYYFAKEAAEQGTHVLSLPLSKERLAEELAIPRPSLSRELGRMQKEGLIRCDRASVEILDRRILQEP